MRPYAISSVFRRNFVSYFSSPTGYVFIVIFIVTGAFLAFNSDRFFASNLADLSSLNTVFPWLPVFFIPAIAMGVWAEERKQGTDELLLTLPITDLEVVLGKYLAVLGVYAVSLFFSLSHVIVLACLGNPDLGLLLGNYLGYLLVGAALIPLAMLASSLSANMTVAFIIGALLCSGAVFGGSLIRQLPSCDSLIFSQIDVAAHLENMLMGVITLSDMIYFGLLAAVCLYLNMILIGRRHWLGGAGKNAYGVVDAVVRGLAITVAAISISILVGRWTSGARLDTTAERLNSLSSKTHSLLTTLPGKDTVYIHAYISPEVPEGLIRHRDELLRKLREFDAIGGNRLIVDVKETIPFTESSTQAADHFGIRPMQIPDMRAGKMQMQNVFMGLGFKCGPHTEVLEFLEPGLSVEYELIRSVRAVSGAARRKIGILNTDAKMFGGFDFQTMSPQQPWSIVKELKKQYDVVGADANQPLSEDIDVLIAGLPSSLNQRQMNNLSDYILSGRPALLFLDPLPINMPQLSASQPKPPKGGAMGRMSPPEPKGNIDALMTQMGVSWGKDRIIWQDYNPLPRFGNMPQEIVFVSSKSGNDAAFGSADDPINKGLKTVVSMFPGHIQSVPGSDIRLASLLVSNRTSGEHKWGNVVQRPRFGFGGMSIKRDLRHTADQFEYVLAARLHGVFPGTASDGKDGSKGVPARVIIVADLDLIGEEFFALRKQGQRELDFDNVTFALNCVDSLAGDESLIAVRSRRPEYRSLTLIENEREIFSKGLLTEEGKAQADADAALQQARTQLTRAVERVRKRKDIDERTKQGQLDYVQKIENDRLQTKTRRIEQSRQERIARARRGMQEKVSAIESRVRLWAVVLPPLPALLMGLMVFLMQRKRENRFTR
jgi:gliding motility-associated transport system permease protein/gliding motility-associatede transport system auxiliary component